MAQYKYLQVQTELEPGSPEFGELLNKYGQEGWELIRQFDYSKPIFWVLIFLKRKAR